MVEYALGTIRINFFQIISPVEYKAYEDDSILKYDKKLFPNGMDKQLFTTLCQKFMEGPVTLVCKRLNCAKQVLSTWYPAYYCLLKSTSCTLVHDDDDGKAVCGAIMSMHRCALMMEGVVSRKRCVVYLSLAHSCSIY